MSRISYYNYFFTHPLKLNDTQKSEIISSINEQAPGKTVVYFVDFDGEERTGTFITHRSIKCPQLNFDRIHGIAKAKTYTIARGLRNNVVEVIRAMAAN